MAKVILFGLSFMLLLSGIVVYTMYLANEGNTFAYLTVFLHTLGILVMVVLAIACLWFTIENLNP